MVEITRLENGVTVATERLPQLKTAALLFSVHAGARQEKATENGLAHLFEHMVFKGTARRTAKMIAEEMENVGGSLNAWTERERTVFHAQLLGSDIGRGMDILADMLTAPLFAADDLAPEKKVILSEIGEALDTPDDLVFEELQKVAFPRQPLGRPILGTAANIARLDPDHLQAWRTQHYHAANIIISAAGNVEHQQILSEADRLLGSLPAAISKPLPPARWSGGSSQTPRDSEQTHIALAFEGPARTDDSYMAALLFATILGGGTASRLFQELREKKGMAYSVSASLSGYAETGIFTLYAATRPADAQAALQEMRDIAHATARTLTQEEWQRARAQLTVGTLTGLEGAHEQADWISRSLQEYGRFISADELTEKINAPDIAAIQKTAAAMLASTEALSVVGPNADALR